MCVALNTVLNRVGSEGGGGLRYVGLTYSLITIIKFGAKNKSQYRIRFLFKRYKNHELWYLVVLRQILFFTTLEF